MKFPQVWHIAASIALQGLTVLCFQKFLAYTDLELGIMLFAYLLGAFSLLSSFSPELLFKSAIAKEDLDLNAWLSRSLSWFLLWSIPTGLYLASTHLVDFFSWPWLLLLWFFALNNVLLQTWLAHNAAIFNLRYHLIVALLHLIYLIGLALMANYWPLSTTSLVYFYFGSNILPIVFFVLPNSILHQWHFTLDWKRLAPVMLILSAGFLSAKLGDFLVKDLAISRLSIRTYTHWQMITRLSEIWFSGLGPLLSVVLFPLLNRTKPNQLFGALIEPLWILLAIHVAIGIAAFSFADLWLSLFYTSSFTHASEAFAIEWGINFFKACTWVIGFVWIIQKRTKVFIVLELVSLVYLVLVVYLVSPTITNLLFWLGSRYLLYVIISFSIFWYANRTAAHKRAVHRT